MIWKKNTGTLCVQKGGKKHPHEFQGRTNKNFFGSQESRNLVIKRSILADFSPLSLLRNNLSTYLTFSSGNFQLDFF